MQISVEATQGLEKRMTIEVPSDKIESEVTKRLQSMRPNVKLQGFRPGRVPMSVIIKKFADQVRQEVTGEVISSSFYDAVTEKSLKPAGMPRIERPVPSENGLTFTATFEVYPEFQIKGLDSIKVEKPVVDINEADIDSMIEKLRKQRTEWESVTRAAQMEDQVTVNFKGTINGEAFKGGEAENMPLILGAKRMIDGFEDALIGKTLNETINVDLKFPETYHSTELAGKVANFTIKINKIEQPKLPDVTETFIKDFGIEDGNLESFRTELKQNMQRELDRVTTSKVKDQVMNCLLESNQFDIPKSMIQSEGARIANQMNEQLQMSGNKLPKDMKMFEGHQFEAEGKRRVALGLILAEIIKSNKIKAEASAIRAEIQKLASSYHDPQEVINWYYQDKNRLSEIESVVLENKVVDWVLEQAQVTDKVTTFEEIMKDSR